MNVIADQYIRKIIIMLLNIVAFTEGIVCETSPEEHKL